MEQRNAKQSLRQTLLSQRPQPSVGLAEQLQAAVAALAAKSIASYQPLYSEPDVSQFNAWAEERFEVYYPRVDGDSLVFAKPPMIAGKFGLSEPTGLQAEISAIDLVLVPALAVDLEGHRLGKGKGFYDRALLGPTQENLYAVVFDSEVLPQVPSEPHDQQVTGIITPTRAIRISTR